MIWPIVSAVAGCAALCAYWYDVGRQSGEREERKRWIDAQREALERNRDRNRIDR